MDKIKEEFEKWYEVEMMTLQSCILPKDDPIKEFAFILYKSRDEEIKKLRDGLQTIIDLGFDNDGFETIMNLKGLIAELVQIAKKTIEGKFCHMCHGYRWNIVDKETGEAQYCPVCNQEHLKDGK